MTEAPAQIHSLVKVSVAFEPVDYDWLLARSTELYGRRGIGLYIRNLVKEDREQAYMLAAQGLEGVK